MVTDTDQNIPVEGNPSAASTEQTKLPSLAKSKAYFGILDLARKDQQNVASLRLLLILINAHPKLRAHYRIFENLAIILDTPPMVKAMATNPAWGNQVPIWKELCQWVISNKNRFAQHESLRQFDYDDPMADPRKPNEDFPHPLNRNLRGFTRHAVCSCLFNRHTSIADYNPPPATDCIAYQYLCLQAQLFVAYINCRYVPNRFTQMVRYTGVEEWPSVPIHTDSVSRAIRQLNRDIHSNLLTELSADSAPADFTIRLPNVQVPASINNGLAKDEVDKEMEHAKLILGYLKHYFSSVEAHLSNKFKKTTRKHRPSSKGSARTLTGYIHSVAGVWVKQPVTEDDDDIPPDPAGEVQISDNPDDPECREAERSGLAPDEVRTPIIKLYNPDEFGGAMMRAKQAEMAKAMAAQKFSWDYEVLTSTELRRLWALLNRTISNTGTLNSKASAMSHPVQCALMLKIMLLLGQDLETARTLHISHDGSTDTDGLVFHPPNNGRPGWWQLPSLAPQYRTDLPEKLERFGRNKSAYISLPDIAGLGNDVLTNLKLSERDKKRVFSPEEKTAKMVTQALLDQTIESWIKPNTEPNTEQEIKEPKPPQKQRITLTKIRNALRTRLRQLSGDNAIEWITSAQINYRNQPRMHYTNLSDHQVATAYIAAVRRLLKDLGEPVMAVPDLVAPSLGYHGARFVASMNSIRSLVSSVAKQLEASPSHYDRAGIITYHNWFTFHLWLLQSLCTSIRAINNPDPIISAHANNPRSEYVGLSDKENPEQADKARLVRMPELLIQQIEEYRLHVDWIRREFSIKDMLDTGKNRLVPRLFKFSLRKVAGPVTCGWCETTMDELGIPLPGNFHRGFLRTELIARGCSGQVVDAFLGHFNQGESPFFTYSTMDYLKWQDKLFVALDRLIDETGILFQKSALVLK